MNGIRQFVSLAACFGLLIASSAVSIKADNPKSKPSSATAAPDAQAIQKARQKGLDYLQTSQSADGSWTTNRSSGITGLILIAAMRSGLAPAHPMVSKGLEFLTKNVQKDGGIYAPKGTTNYETCIGIVAFKEANRNGKYDKIIADAAKFLKNEQWSEEKGVKPSDTNYGGAGYGGKSRPDLSNTQFLIEALRAAGTPADDPSLQKALKFVSRCQNLESQANTTEFAGKIDDGGFYYTPSAGGASAAGKDAKGGLRSYGTMTYAGLKSMIHCEVKADDPRVKAAVGWIRRHYSVSENPGVGKAGLFYYQQTFAKALQALGQDVIEDQSGVKHNWRQDLARQVVETQLPNGSWVNSDKKWFEGDPNLATGYSLLTLSFGDAPPSSERKTATP